MKLPADVEAWAKRIQSSHELFSVNKPEWIDAAAQLGSVRGDLSPWRCVNDLIEFRAGESTLWGGANGHGKTQVLAHLTAFWAAQNKHVLSLSLEMSPASQIARIARLVLARGDLSHADIKAVAERLEETFTIAAYEGRISPSMVLAIALFAARELRVHHMVIDNLTQLLPVGNDSADKMQEFVSNMHQIAHQTGLHVHVVAHIRKPEDKRKVPDRYDIRGTGSAPDQVDNVLLVWRNESKEDARSDGDTSKNREADCVIRVDKQRHNGIRGLAPLFYHHNSGQFLSGFGGAEPIQFSVR